MSVEYSSADALAYAEADSTGVKHPSQMQVSPWIRRLVVLLMSTDYAMHGGLQADTHTRYQSVIKRGRHELYAVQGIPRG